ncbi:MAG: ABC transporter substrate-binding protein [Desulfobacterales bacterium]|nr:ABC transporter substrate-binding protein [Desulfobacterales bacterium]
MKTSAKFALGSCILLLIIIAALLVPSFFNNSTTPKTPNLTTVRVAVTPYQDTTLMLYGKEKGYFKEVGIDLQVRDSTWNEQIEFTAGKGCDIAMATIDEIVAKSRSLNKVGKRVLYFLPAWLFEGTIFACRDDMLTYKEVQQKYGEEGAKAKFLAQLKDKIIAVPEGGVYEQAIHKFIESAGLNVDDFQFVNSQLEVGINGLRDEDVGIAAAGIVERPEALRRGYKIALDSIDLNIVVITGFICNAEFYNQHTDAVEKYAKGWYKSVTEALKHPKENYKIVKTYIDERGGKPPSFEDFKTALSFQKIAKSPEEAKKMFLDKDSPMYWEMAWDAAVHNLISTGKRDRVPSSKKDFIGEIVLNQIIQNH